MFKSVCLLVIVTLVRAQGLGPACSPANFMTSYNLSSLTSAPTVNTTSNVCKSFFRTNGACVEPSSVTREMNLHNAWLAYKALDAQRLALQYVNMTVYTMNTSGLVGKEADYPVDSSWYSDELTEGDYWWQTLKNKFTAVFKKAQQWNKNVFNAQMDSIVPCMQAWANLTNGAYCLTASSHNFPQKENPFDTNKVSIAYGVSRANVGPVLAKCEPLVNSYCQLSYGISLTNLTASPWNATMTNSSNFNLSDGGMTKEQCKTFRDQVNCKTDALCLQNLYKAYIDLFDSHFIRFIPSKAFLIDLGYFFTNFTVPEKFKSSNVAARSGNGFTFYVDDTSPADMAALGANSGQEGRNYIVGSVERLLTAFILAVGLMMV